MNLIRAILSYSCGAALLLGSTTASFAATSKLDKPVAGPYYNSETNSYFQLFRHSNPAMGHNWFKANGLAKRKFHKGERGHLAIVRDRQTLEFVRDKFPKMGNAYIGLRFFCKYRKLLWDDGKFQGPKASGMWHPSWARGGVKNGCGPEGFMSIYLTGSDPRGMLWQATGPAKVRTYFLVEYPAPKKSKDVSQSSKETTVPAGATTMQ